MDGLTPNQEEVKQLRERHRFGQEYEIISRDGKLVLNYKCPDDGSRKEIELKNEKGENKNAVPDEQEILKQYFTYAEVYGKQEALEKTSSKFSIEEEKIKAIINKHYPGNINVINVATDEERRNIGKDLYGSERENADNRPKQLAVTKYDDKYKLIGPVHEQELHEASIKGFDSYQEALDAIKKYGYELRK